MEKSRKAEKGLIIRAVLFFVVLFWIFFFLPLFLSAGTLDYPEGIGFVLLQSVLSGSIGAWLAKHNPSLLKERTSLKREREKSQVIFQILGLPLLLSMIVIPGLTFRYGWPKLPLWAEILGFLGITLSMYAFFLVLKENTFATRIVEIQKARHQKVITTGPYSHVRHPMYSALLVYFFSIPIALGSVYGIAASALMDLVILYRTTIEDKVLQKELPGYKDYVKKTQYRLVPGVW